MGIIKKRKLADEVIDEIIKMIKNKELKPGDKLPNQVEFAAQLGVSRTSLREALNTLTIYGILEQRQGAGTIIKSILPAHYADQLMPPLIENPKATKELLEARQLIEIGIVGLAAKNATKKHIKTMDVLVEEMTEALKAGRIDEYSEKDIAFHFILAQASQNKVLSYLLATIRSLMEQFVQESFKVLPDLTERSLSFHSDIYKSIKNRDSRKAKLFMKKHILDIQKELAQYYKAKKKIENTTIKVIRS